MKKIGLAVLAILIALGAYYFSTGSEQLATAMKKQVNAEFATLQTQGFDVKAKELSKQKEHFVISFDEPEKMAAYFTSKGAKLTAQDAEVFKGLQLGVDVTYLSDAYSSVSFDLYPLTLPTVVTESAKEEEDKAFLAQIQKMLDKKVFLMHVDVNKLGTGFKGYMKDIDEKIQNGKTANLKMSGADFTGEIEDEKLSQLSQVVKTLSLSVDNELFAGIDTISSVYKTSGPTPYDADTSYDIESMKLEMPSENFLFTFKGLGVVSSSKVSNGLASMTLDSHIKEAKFKDATQNNAFDALHFKMDMGNISIEAIEKLEQADPNDEAALKAGLQLLIAQGLSFNINDFSVKTLHMKDKEIAGFNMHSAVTLDKGLDIAQIEQNPMLALSAIDAALKLTLSDDLFAFVAEQPQAVMFMMLIQPKAVNGEKVYEAELKKGKVTVNGQPML